MSKADYDKLFADDDVQSDAEDDESVSEEKKHEEENGTPEEMAKNASQKAFKDAMPKREYQAPAYLYNDKYRDKFIQENPSITKDLSLIHISEPTRPCGTSRMPSSA